MFSRDEMQRAIEDALKSMEGIALELYRRGREEAREELEEARARNADMRAMLEQVTRERDEARAELSKLREDYDSVLEANVGLLDGAPYVDARAAFRRGAEAMRARCEELVKHNSHEDGIGMGSQRIESAIRALTISEEP